MEIIRPAFLPFFNMRFRITHKPNAMPVIKIEGKTTSEGSSSCILTEYEKITGKIANKNG
jgi:hypothetical protein